MQAGTRGMKVLKVMKVRKVDKRRTNAEILAQDDPKKLSNLDRRKRYKIKQRLERLKLKEVTKRRKEKKDEKQKEKKQQHKERQSMSSRERNDFYGATVRWRLALAGIIKMSAVSHMLSPAQKKTLELTRTHCIPRSWDDVSKASCEMMKDDQTISDAALSAVAIAPGSLSQSQRRFAVKAAVILAAEYMRSNKNGCKWVRDMMIGGYEAPRQVLEGLAIKGGTLSSTRNVDRHMITPLMCWSVYANGVFVLTREWCTAASSEEPDLKINAKALDALLGIVQLN